MAEDDFVQFLTSSYIGHEHATIIYFFIEALKHPTGQYHSPSSRRRR